MCYCETGSFQKLCCGHTFCTGCIKNWYLRGVSSSGANSACPMCRRPMYFKGFHKVRDQWDEDAWDVRCSEILSEAMDACIVENLEMAEYFPARFKKDVLEGAIEDLVDIERTFRFLKSENLCAEDIEYVLMDTEDYYSDRRISKVRWIDEPPKSLATRYPWLKQGMSGSQKRVRAWEDPWVTVSFYIEV